MQLLRKAPVRAVRTVPVVRDLAAAPVASAVSEAGASADLAVRDSVAVSAAKAALATAVSILKEIPVMGIRNIIIPVTIWMIFSTASLAEPAKRAAAAPGTVKMCLPR